MRVDIGEVAGLLGYTSRELDQDTSQLIDSCVEELKLATVPKYIKRVLDIEQLQIVGTNISLAGSEDLSQLLAESHQVVLIAATLGLPVDAALRRYSATDLTRALVMDACASSMIECYTEDLNQDLETHYREAGYYLTDRFSPGYGDVPIMWNQKLLDVLNANRGIGLSVSASGTMIPRKSVSAIIGIAKRPQARRDNLCAGCRIQDHCKLREGNRYCGRKI
ncbi:MAG: vitamin B12 dependent-methionine synthase activation domain-containing protein [Tissierellia bacterium]|nr:vitamin B12 dependent-methionine synthase activation domain-containing protein [Tissierellia bacterium]